MTLRIDTKLNASNSFLGLKSYTRESFLFVKLLKATLASFKNEES